MTVKETDEKKTALSKSLYGTSGRNLPEAALNGTLGVKDFKK
ncbi:hypothetical protein V1L52_04120 [Treponema sp. HNW]